MSIRLRLAIVFAVTSAILLALGGWLFVSVLSSSLMNSIDSQLAAQASHGSTYLSSNSAIPTSTLGTNAPEYVVQVIDGANRIRATSAEAPSQPILSSADLRRARTQPVLVTQVRNREHERVLAQPLVGRGGWIVVAGVSLESFDATISRVTTELTIGCALFVLIAALGAYAL